MACELTVASEGEKTHRSVDLFGRFYEYFLTRFVSVEGKYGGQFYEPSYAVHCLAEISFYGRCGGHNSIQNRFFQQQPNSELTQ